MAKPIFRRKLRLAVFTNDRNRPLTKTVSLGEDGKTLQKTSAAQMVRGSVEMVEVADLHALSELFDGLDSSQAVSFGVLRDGRPHAVIATQADRQGDQAARDRDHFGFADGVPGVLMLDFDSPAGMSTTPEEVRAAILDAVPELAAAPMLCRSSASSSVVIAETANKPEGVNGGLHFYVPVKDAASIPTALENIVTRLWSAGSGWIQISSAGSALERTFVDASVGQPERLDFAGPVVIGDKRLALSRTEPILWGDPKALFDAHNIKLDRATIDNADRHRAEARRAREPECARVRAEWVERRVTEIVEQKKGTVSAADARALALRAASTDTLVGAFTLVTSNGDVVTVQDLIDNPKRWDGKRFADPLEPSYGGHDYRIAVARLSNGHPVIFSHAHGGVAFKLVPTEEDAARVEFEDIDDHRSAPIPSEKCLYGLVGEVARAGTEDSEAPPIAVAGNFLAWLGVAVGRRPFLFLDNTAHHAVLFFMHVGRSGYGRKGDSSQLMRRIAQSLQKQTSDAHMRSFEFGHAPAILTGGLSTREGLVVGIADPTGAPHESPGFPDKRQLVIESELANTLRAGQRDGNTLSAALRDAWDGHAIKPLIKSQRTGCDRPHIGLTAGITTHELKALLSQVEAMNGFAGRFLICHAERTKRVAFPKSTDQKTVDAFAARVTDILDWVYGEENDLHDGTDKTENQIQFTFSPEAIKRYSQEYLTGELSREPPGEQLAALMVRRAAMVWRLSMLFAITDKTTTMTVDHLEAALAWVRHWDASVRFVFRTAKAEVIAEHTSAAAAKIVAYLKARGRASRTDLTLDCFGGHENKARIDAALDELLHSTPPSIALVTVPRASGTGTPTKFYQLVQDK